MAEAVIGYDKDLPEIPGPPSVGKANLLPSQGRRRGDGMAGGRVRQAPEPIVVGAEDPHGGGRLARRAGYKGASDITLRLFEYWFEEDHEVPGFGVPLRYYFCQREAIETLVWLVEVAVQRDARELIQAHATIFEKDLFYQEPRVPDHDGRSPAASALRAGT